MLYFTLWNGIKGGKALHKDHWAEAEVTHNLCNKDYASHNDK